MAKKNAIILCLFLVLFIFFKQYGETKKHINKMHKTCKEKWETVCVIPEDCDAKCLHDHGKQANTDCLVQEGPTGGDLCVCNYAC
ncbi:hypothetical protein MKW92_001397 [Papaver armeniacum]|nr:hypothetical protein MKW92_001397 [Papaver armeniacum]